MYSMKRTFTLIAAALLAGQMQAQSLYGDMEVWRTYNAGFPPKSLEAPQGWNCPDSIAVTLGPFVGGGTYAKQLFKTTDAHSGSYAAKVMTVTQGSFGSIPGLLTNATIEVDVTNQTFALSGGTPLVGRVNYINAWVKYSPMGDDSANIAANAIITGGASDGTDSSLGMGYAAFGALSSYTLISIPLTYDDPNSQPDAIQVIFASSGSQAVDSSVLYVDDVSYTLFPAAVTTVANNIKVSCYPNPAHNTFYVQGPDNMELHWQACNISGQVTGTAIIKGNTPVDRSAYMPGMYFYTVTDTKGNVLQRSKFTVER